MKILTPQDIANYIYCPILQKSRKQKLFKPLTFFESCLRLALIEGERNALLKGNIVTPRRLLATWDKIWWSEAAKKDIPIKEAQRLTLKASEKLTDYCRYDLSSQVFPNIAVLTGAETHKNKYIFQARTDIIKVNLTTSNKTTVLVNFTNRNLNIIEAALDPYIRSTVYMFNQNKGEHILHVNVDISNTQGKLRITSSNFSPKEIEEIGKMIYHIERAIGSNIYYMNPYKCKECKACQPFKS
jgi:hypothetical protein